MTALTREGRAPYPVSPLLRGRGTERRMDAVLAQRAELVRFVRARVESDAVAEEIVQAALLRAVERAAQLRDESRARAWMYRALRNAVVDHYRRRDAAERALACA